MDKSGKMSCCGRGGSWFRNCGGSGNTKLAHTWSEGTQACKSRSQSTVVAKQKGKDSSHGADITNYYKAVIAATERFTFTSANTSMSMSDTTSTMASSYTPDNVAVTTSAQILTAITTADTLMTSSTHTSTSTSITAQGCEKLPVLQITIDIHPLFIIVMFFLA